MSVTANVLGIPKASLDNWVKLSAKGQLKGAGDTPLSAKQNELVRLRSQLARILVRKCTCVRLSCRRVHGATP